MSAVLRSASVESWEDHVEAWHHLGREVDGAAWGRAAIAASLKGRYGEDAVDKFAAEVGFSRTAIYGFAATFEAFPEKSTRVDNLTFSHHRLAAELTDTAEEARAAIAMAEREGWSANALRAHLRPRQSLEAIAPPATTPACAEPESCGPVTNSAKVFHIASLVESLIQSLTLFEAIKDYEVDPLVRVGTRKSLDELSRKIDRVVAWLESPKDVVDWLEALRETIKRRAQCATRAL